MTGPNQTVEVRLKLVVDKDGTRAVDALTGAVVAAAKAEDSLAEAAKRRGRAEQEAARVVDRNRWGREVESALRARGLDARGNPLSAVRGRLTPGTAAAYGEQASAALSRLGISGPMAAAGFGATAALSVGSYATEAAQIDARPFLSAREREDQKLRGLPLGIGRGYGYLKDLQEATSGETGRIGRAGMLGRIGSITQELEGRQRLESEQVAREVASARSRAAEFGPGFRLGRPAGYDRTTVEGERRFRDEQRLLPIRQQLTTAAKERAAAERDVARATEVELQKKRALDEAEQRLKVKVQERVDASRSGSAAAAGRAGTEAEKAAGAAEGFREREARLRELQDATEAKRAAELRLNERRGAEGGKRVELARAEYQIAQGREQQAAGGAQSLSQLGLGGRELAKQGLALINQGVPLDQIPDDLLSAARAAAPDTVRKAEEKYGEQYKGEIRPLAPEEAGLQDSAGARQRTDKTREAATQAEEKEQVRSAQDTARVLADFERAFTAVLASLTNVTMEVNRLREEGIMARTTGNQ